MTPASGGVLGVAEVLDRAADRLEVPDAWRQDILYARRADGSHVAPTGDGACQFCMIGAIAHVWGKEAGDVEEALRQMPEINDMLSGGRFSPVNFNDAAGRTQAEVVAALRSAAEAARENQS